LNPYSGLNNPKLTTQSNWLRGWTDEKVAENRFTGEVILEFRPDLDRTVLAIAVLPVEEANFIFSETGH